MRPTLLATAFLICKLGASSQTLFEAADQRTDIVYYTNVVDVGNGLWAFMGWANPEGGIPVDMHFVTAREASTGNVVWTTAVPMVNYGVPLLALSDTSILVAGSVDYCDYPSGILAIMKIGGDGTVEWTKQIAVGSESAVHMATGHGPWHAVATQDSVFAISLVGDSITSWPSPAQPVRALTWQNDSTLLILADSSLFRTDLNGAVLASIDLGSPGIDVSTANGAIHVLNAAHVLVLDPSLSIVSAPWLPSGGPISFVEDTSQSFVLCASELVELDSAFIPASVTDLDLLPGHSIRSAALRNGVLVTAGEAIANACGAGLARNHLLDGSHVVHEDDVELAIQIDSAWYQFAGGSGSEVWCAEKAQATAILTNNGSVALESIVVNYRTPFAYGLCGTPGQTLIHTGTPIPPGGTATLAMPVLNIRYAPCSSVPNDTQYICMVAESPNEHVDRDPSDNQACESVTITWTGIAEEPIAGTLSVYPQPFDDQLSIMIPGSATGQMSLSLTDVAGRNILHRSEEWMGGAVLALSTTALPPGSYVLVLQGAGRTWRTKVQCVR